MNLEFHADREAAHTVACNAPPPLGCGAPIGSPCRNLLTGEPLQRLPAHTSRLRAAGVTHTPLDPADLRRPPGRKAPR